VDVDEETVCREVERFVMQQTPVQKKL
jgi:hypothetical protein